MARIIVDPPPTSHNLLTADFLTADFLKALNLLHDGGFELRSGTKLTSRYAVLVVEDSAAAPAIEKLISANLNVARDTH